MRERRAEAAVLLGALDFGLLILVGPRIDGSLRLGDAYAWLFSAGSFAFAAALPAAGALVERQGARRVLRGGALLWALGLGALSVAPAFPVALAARVVTGVGGAALLPAAWTLLGERSGASRRRGFAASGGAVALGFSLGIALGGPGADALGWRLACALAAIPAAFLALAPWHGPSPVRGAGAPDGTAWLVGAAALVGVAAGVRTPAPAVALAAFAASIACAARVRRAAWLPSRWAGLRFCLLGLATTASGVGATALIGRELVSRGDGSAATLMAFGAAAPLALPVAAGLMRESGAAACGVAGLALQGAALAALAATHAHVWALVGSLLVFGVGHVLANAGTAQLAMGGGGPPGPVASLLGMAQYLGGALGALVVLGAADYERGLWIAAAIAAGGAAAGVMAGRRAGVPATARIPSPS